MLLLFLACQEQKIDTGTAPLPPWEIDADGDGSTADVDCDDANPEIAPGADERCDGVDEDCDGAVDEEAVDAPTWHADADGDGYGDSEGEAACEAISGWLADGSDCDDADATVHPGADESCDGRDDDCDDVIDEDTPADSPTWHPDADGDGYGDPDTGEPHCADAPAGWTEDATDCDDADAAVSPSGTEVCDGVDQDCDDAVDDDPIDGRTYYTDADGDGYGDPDAAVAACAPLAGTVSDATDCDDADPAVSPAAGETCDGIDQDCDGTTDEDSSDAMAWYADGDGDGYGAGTPTVACTALAGTVATDGDCDDTIADVYPGADEHCDRTDEDCDGTTDNDAVDASTWYVDADGDRYGDADVSVISCQAPRGYVADATDCDDGEAVISPSGTEVCDDVDQDCDGTVDEDAVDAPTWYADSDADGYGDPDVSVVGCDAPTGMITDGSDCDDAVATTSPAGIEVCGGADEDCDGTTDEDDAADAPTWYTDADGDTHGDPALATRACLAPAGTDADGDDCDDTDALVYPGRPETCSNGHDDDCDGDDDGCALAGDYAALDVYQAAVVGGDGTVAFVGDVDADGDGELLVEAGEEGWLVDGVPYGDVHVADVDDWFYPTDSVAGVGDFDGDGYADCAFGYSSRAANAGVAWLVRGPWSGEKTGTEADVTVEGANAEQVGLVMAGVGDVDGDGLDDWAIGGPRGDSSTGAVYLLLGGASGTFSASDADVTLYGADASDQFGAAIAGVGDLDADGMEDVAVGAPYAGSLTGAAYVFLDPVGSSTADVTLTGSATAVEAGRAIVAADTDGDGARELAVSAPYGGTRESGAVYLVSGPWSGSAALTDSPSVEGEDVRDHIGFSLAAGDFDADGYDDLFVGGGSSDRGVTDGGAVYGLFGPGPWDADVGLADVVLVPTMRANLGYRLATGDTQEDGYADLLISATTDTSLGSSPGVAWLVVGQGI